MWAFDLAHTINRRWKDWVCSLKMAELINCGYTPLFPFFFQTKKLSLILTICHCLALSESRSQLSVRGELIGMSSVSQTHTHTHTNTVSDPGLVYIVLPLIHWGPRPSDRVEPQEYVTKFTMLPPGVHLKTLELPLVGSFWAIVSVDWTCLKLACCYSWLVKWMANFRWPFWLLSKTANAST